MRERKIPGSSGNTGRSGIFRRPGKDGNTRNLHKDEARFVGARLLELLFAPITHLPVIVPAAAAAWLMSKALEKLLDKAWQASFWPLVAESVSLIICLRLAWLLLRHIRQRIYTMAGMKKYATATVYALYIALCYAVPGWLAGTAMFPDIEGGKIAGAICTSIVGFIFYCQNMGLSSPLLHLLRRLLRLPPSEKG